VPIVATGDDLRFGSAYFWRHRHDAAGDAAPIWRVCKL